MSNEKKINLSNGNTQSNLDIESYNMGILQDEKIFYILSNGLYPDIYIAIIRELLCNAYDATLDAGGYKSYNKTKLIITPTEIIIRDYGIGLSKEKFIEIMLNYGKSTKEMQKESIGALGLGSKSPFAYCEMFFVNSYHNGKVFKTVTSVENGNHKYNSLGETETNKRNGVEYRIPLTTPEDAVKFYNAAMSVFAGFDNPRSMFEFVYFPDYAESDEYVNIDADDLDGVYRKPLMDPKKYLTSINCNMVEDDIHVKLVAKDYRDSDVIIQMSNILYDLASHPEYEFYYKALKELTDKTDYSVVIKVPNNCLKFTPCRFRLKLEEDVIEKVWHILNRALISLKRFIIKLTKSRRLISIPFKYNVHGVDQLREDIDSFKTAKNRCKIYGANLDISVLDIDNSETNSGNKVKMGRYSLSKTNVDRIQSYLRAVINKNEIPNNLIFIRNDYRGHTRHTEFWEFIENGELDNTLEISKYYDYKLGNLSYTLGDLITERETKRIKLLGAGGTGHKFKNLTDAINKIDASILTSTIYNAEYLLQDLNTTVKQTTGSKLVYPLMNSATNKLDKFKQKQVQTKAKYKFINIRNSVQMVGNESYSSTRSRDYRYFNWNKKFETSLLNEMAETNEPFAQKTFYERNIQLYKNIIIIPVRVDLFAIKKDNLTRFNNILRAELGRKSSMELNFVSKADANIMIEMRLHHLMVNNCVIFSTKRDSKVVCKYLEEQYPNKNIQIKDMDVLFEGKQMNIAVKMMIQKLQLFKFYGTVGDIAVPNAYNLSQPNKIAQIVQNLNFNEDEYTKFKEDFSNILGKYFNAFKLYRTIWLNLNRRDKVIYLDLNLDKAKDKHTYTHFLDYKNQLKYISRPGTYDMSNLRIHYIHETFGDEHKIDSNKLNDQFSADIKEILKPRLKRFNILERRFIRSNMNILMNSNFKDLEIKERKHGKIDFKVYEILKSILGHNPQHLIRYEQAFEEIIKSAFK